MSAPTVLFVCQHNAGRSQLGAHLLAHTAPGRFVATSAGITPADRINPVVAESLAELGIDATAARPRAVTVGDLAAAKIVVAMKPRLTLPGPVTGELIEWEFPDPDNWGIDGVRDLRDRVRIRVEELTDARGITWRTS